MAEAERTIGEMIKLAQELPDFRIIKSIPSKNADLIKQWSGRNAKQYKSFKVLRRNCQKIICQMYEYVD